MYGISHYRTKKNLLNSNLRFTYREKFLTDYKKKDIKSISIRGLGFRRNEEANRKERHWVEEIKKGLLFSLGIFFF